MKNSALIARHSVLVVMGLLPTVILPTVSEGERICFGSSIVAGALCGLKRQNDYGFFERVLAEVAIKGESMIESVMINQCKAGAIDEAKVFVIISSENRLCCLFNRFANTENFDAGLGERLHEIDRRGMTHFEANQRICLRENKVGG